jgi:hypothetical protein
MPSLILPKNTLPWLVALSALVPTAQARIEPVWLEGELETGRFAKGSPEVLAARRAGATLQAFPNVPFRPWLGSWVLDDVDAVRWAENPLIELAGDRYLYLSGQDTSVSLLYGSGFGVHNYFTSLVPGQTYELTWGAALAQDTGIDDPPGALEVGFKGDRPTAMSSRPAHPAWSQALTNTIPWEIYTVVFTPTSAYARFTLNTEEERVASSELNEVIRKEVIGLPEPGPWALATWAAVLGSRRRRR